MIGIAAWRLPSPTRIRIRFGRLGEPGDLLVGGGQAGSEETAADRRPELVFGLVGAAGTDLNLLVNALCDELRALDYTPHPIVVSELLADLPKYSYLKNLKDGKEEDRINRSMDAGNDLRRTLGTGAGAICLALSKVRQVRKEVGGDVEKRLSGHAFIIKSLKNPAETQALRKIYDDAYIQISMYEPKYVRLEDLTKRIAKSHGRFELAVFEDKAKQIIERDEQEKGNVLGQNVGEVFPLADHFVAMGTQLRQQIERFIHIPFRFPIPDADGRRVWDVPCVRCGAAISRPVSTSGSGRYHGQR
jgi:hypothetical protein